MTLNVIEALVFPFQDRNWINKLLITLVLVFIPILGWLIIGGYSVRVVRRVLNDESGMPEYDDWGGDIARGLGVLIGALIYSIPSMILSGISAQMGGFGPTCMLGMAQFLYNLFMTPLMMSAADVDDHASPEASAA